jgi:short-subunit dehydrogenase
MEQVKSYVITGVSSGIGYELCRQLVDRGHRVFGSVRNQKDATQLSNELGSNFIPLIFDVTDYEAVDASVQTVEKTCPEGIDGLINNAGIAVGGPLLHIPMDQIEKQFQVNVFGLIKVTQAFAPLLGARSNHSARPGRILQISSVSGKIGFPFIAPYVGSKHAVEGISASLRRELLKYGIDVIVIGPGAVKTPIWEKGEEDVYKSNYLETDYVASLEIFQGKFVKQSLKTALSVEYLVKRIMTILQSEHPKTRYTFISQKLTNYLLPRLLPDRIFDRILKKGLKL